MHYFIDSWVYKTLLMKAKNKKGNHCFFALLNVSHVIKNGLTSGCFSDPQSLLTVKFNGQNYIHIQTS